MGPTEISERADWRDWPRPSLAVDVAVLTVQPTEYGPQLALLVLRRETEVYPGQWDIPGAFVRERERLSDTVRRALLDKAGVTDLTPSELGVFDDPDRDPRGWVVSVAYSVAVPFARLQPALAGGAVELAPITTAGPGPDRVPDTDPDTDTNADRGPARPRPREPRPVVAPASPPIEVRLPDGQAELPFDHAAMVGRAVSVLRERYEVRSDPAPGPEPDPDRLMTQHRFTMSQLRALYDTILGAQVHRDAFSRRFAPRPGDSGRSRRLRPAGESRAQTRGRPAQLYEIG